MIIADLRYLRLLPTTRTQMANACVRYDVPNLVINYHLNDNARASGNHLSSFLFCLMAEFDRSANPSMVSGGCYSLLANTQLKRFMSHLLARSKIFPSRCQNNTRIFHMRHLLLSGVVYRYH